MMSFAQWGNALYSGEKSYKVVDNRRRFVLATLIVLVVSLLIVAVFGLNRSIEFTGGSQFTVVGVSESSEAIAREVAAEQELPGEIRVTSLGVDSMRVQAETLDPDAASAMRDALAKAYKVESGSVQYESIGPSWGKDVTYQAALSLLIFLGLVSVLMTIYFRSWTMSLSAMIALLHDVFVTVAFFALVRAEVSPATVIGFLTILGYSLYDTVVVFDKVRELTVDVWDQKRYTFAERVNLAVNQTLVRSINTSIVALLPVGAILFIGSYLLGAGTLIDISLALFVGMIAGTYSSIFIASTLLVLLEDRRARTRDHNALVERARERRAGRESKAEELAVSLTEDAPAGVVAVGQRLSNRAQPSRKKKKR